jgi:hypothetical protein
MRILFMRRPRRSSHVPFFLLLETGGFLLLETGGKILL